MNPLIDRFLAGTNAAEEALRGLTDADALFVGKEWTDALRTSNPTIAVEWWVARHDGGACAVPVHTQQGRPSRAPYDATRVFDAELGTSALGGLRYSLIGTRNGQANGFLRSGERNPMAERALLEAVVRHHEQDVVAMLYVDSSLARLLRELSPRPTASRLIDATAQMTLTGRSMDDFADHVVGRRRRMKIRQEIRRISNEPPLKVLDNAEQIARLAAKLAPLARAVNERHGQDTTDEKMRNYIGSIADCGLRAVLLLGGVEEAPRSFALGVTDGNILSVRTCGFDYGAIDDGPGEYARCVVYGPMEWALDNGVSRLDLGTGTLHAKTLRGADAEPLYGAVWAPGVDGSDRSASAEDALVRSLLETAPRLDAAEVHAWQIA